MAPAYQSFTKNSSLVKTDRGSRGGLWGLWGQDAGSAAQAVDACGALAEAGVTWTTMGVPSPSRVAFAENVQWFGEEVAAKLG